MKMHQLQMHLRCKLYGVGALLAAVVIASLVASCGGDFEYKTSGDRLQGENRANTGEFYGASTASHENLMSIQEQYKAKLEAEAGKK
ncbi:MAG: hypothetical protein OXO54_04100 [Chloroflexota bacterium]|nr:hypothetical protein [Chloroflexota bacterium]